MGIHNFKRVQLAVKAGRSSRWTFVEPETLTEPAGSSSAQSDSEHQDHLLIEDSSSQDDGRVRIREKNMTLFPADCEQGTKITWECGCSSGSHKTNFGELQVDGSMVYVNFWADRKTQTICFCPLNIGKYETPGGRLIERLCRLEKPS